MLRNLTTPVRQKFASFSIINFHNVFFGRKLLYLAQTLKSRELCFISLRVEYLYKLFGICLHRDLSLPPHYLFNYLFMSEWIHGYFILWVIIQYHFILSIWSSLIWLLCCFSTSSSFSFFFLIGPYFLIKMPQAHFEHFLPTPIISHFSKEPWLPLLENNIRNPILSVRCASLYWSFVSYF